MKFKQHLKQVAIAFDQLANTMIGGWADESLSSRSHRLAEERGRKWPKRIINALFFWEKDHCKEAYESEIERLQVPPQMRQFEDDSAA